MLCSSPRPEPGIYHQPPPAHILPLSLLIDDDDDLLLLLFIVDDGLLKGRHVEDVKHLGQQKKIRMMNRMNE